MREVSKEGVCLARTLTIPCFMWTLPLLAWRVCGVREKSGERKPGKFGAGGRSEKNVRRSGF